MKKLTGFLFILALFASCSPKLHRSASYEQSSTRGWDDEERNDGDFELTSMAGLSESGKYEDLDQYLAESKRQRQETNREHEDRIVIYNANLRLTVKRKDSINSQLEAIAKKHDGYALTLGSYQTEIRVKADQLKAALSEIGTLGKVAHQSVSGYDVTNEFHDYEIRLENAYKARKRYLELLEKAANVEEALLVEKELERLNGEIDSMQGRLKRLSHLSDFSTITIYVQEKVKPGPLGYIAMGVYDSVKWLFVRN